MLSTLFETGGILDAHQIDGVSAVLGALAASAGAGVGEAVKDATKNTVTAAKDRLLSLVRRRLGNDAVGRAKLTVYAAEPTPRNGQAVHEHLLNAGVGQDQEILTLAREVLQAAGPAALAPGSVAANVISQVNEEGGTGFIGGHHIHNHNAAARPSQVQWEILPIQAQIYELRNTGEGQASEVVVTAQHAVRFTPPSHAGPWTADSGHEFFAAGSFQSGHPIITVTWRDGLGGPKSWTRPLPQ